MSYQQMLSNNSLNASDIAAGQQLDAASNRRRAARALSTMLSRIFPSSSTAVPPLSVYDVELPTEFLKAHATVNWMGGRGEITVPFLEYQHAKNQWEQNKKDTCILYFNANSAAATYSALSSAEFLGGIRYSEYSTKGKLTVKGDYKFPQKYIHSV